VSTSITVITESTASGMIAHPPLLTRSQTVVTGIGSGDGVGFPVGATEVIWAKAPAVPRKRPASEQESNFIG